MSASSSWLTLTIKMASTALAVTLASTVAEAAGPVWGALAASLPVSAGPAYIFLALSHDTAFVARSAVAGFAANTATILFLAVYVRLASRLHPAAALAAAIIAWMLVAAFIDFCRPGALVALALNTAAFIVGVLATRSATARPQPAPVLARRWFDLPLRAIVVAVFVVLIVTLGNFAGPAATGALASFPIVFVTMIALLQGRIGHEACATLAATALRAMGGFGLMLFVLSLAVVPLGASAALSLALGITLLWSATLVAQKYLRTT